MEYVPNIPGCAAGCFSSVFDFNKIQNNEKTKTRFLNTFRKDWSQGYIYIEVNNEWVNREWRKHLKYKHCIAYALLASYGTTKTIRLFQCYL